MSPAVDWSADCSSEVSDVHPRRAKRRTCVGCRSTDERARLVRVRVSVGTTELVVDEHGRLPGRGAWLHPTAQCVDLAIQRRGFVRALRLTTSPDVRSVQEWVSTHDASSTGDAKEKNRKRV